MSDIKDKPLVAIRCITYNHELYIRDALEGFVMQKTNFPFVAIVHDDASTDGTAAIIREYAEKYPDIIKPIYETENQYSKHNGSIGRIMNKGCEETGAKYIAMCEGDDYWTDPLKLQKQVDFLESHPECSLCFHQVNKKTISGEFNLVGKVENRVYGMNEWFVMRPTQTSSYLFKSHVYKTEFYHELFDNGGLMAGDIMLALLCAKIGELHGLSDTMSVYRLTPDGWTLGSINETTFWKKINLQDSYKVFGKEIENSSKIFYTRECIQAFITLLKVNHQFKPLFLLASIRKSPYLTLKAILNKFNS